MSTPVVCRKCSREMHWAPEKKNSAMPYNLCGVCCSEYIQQLQVETAELKAAVTPDKMQKLKDLLAEARQMLVDSLTADTARLQAELIKVVEERDRARALAQEYITAYEKLAFGESADTNSIPVEEQWLYKNKEALNSVRQGLKESAEGKVSKGPSFEETSHIEPDKMKGVEDGFGGSDY